MTHDRPEPVARTDHGISKLALLTSTQDIHCCWYVPLLLLLRGTRTIPLPCVHFPFRDDQEQGRGAEYTEISKLYLIREVNDLLVW